jgi:hypothetical protein
MSNFDIGIIGAGVAGSFATLRIAKEYSNAKTIVFDLGRPPMKRRRQLEGWLGCLPNSDGKLYQSDIAKVTALTGVRRTKSANNWVSNVLSDINQFKINKDKPLTAALSKRINKLGFEIVTNDYMQMYPKDVHFLSKYISDAAEECKNITFSFDNEIKTVYKQKGYFIIVSEGQEYRCKKIIVAVGRSGWRWARDLFNSFSIIENNDIARFGVRVEMNSSYMKDFAKSSCSLVRDDLEIGPLSWNGSVIPEDHVDMAISAFRSNENRWASDKVSFSVIGNREYPNKGFEQTDRLAKLTFVLTNDRIIKERICHILTGKSKISIIPEYDWLAKSLTELNAIMPELTTKGYYHAPTILPLAPKINIGTNLETEIEGMFVVGESAGIPGLLAAAISGVVAIDSICK